MTPVVLFRGVHKVYPKGIEALKGVDLVVEEGEAVGLAGPNGAGKTTIVKLVLGLIGPTTGSVRVWGHDSLDLPRHLKLQIGYLLEERGLYDVLTVEENLIFWAKVYGVGPQAVERSLQAWGLWNERRKRAKHLSAGMQQRLSLARCTLHDPLLLVLDEPTSNLDPETRREVVDLLSEYMAQKKALLLTSHDLFDMERIVNRIALIRRGEIIAEGSMGELQAQLGVGRKVRIRLAQALPETLARVVFERYGAKQLGERELLASADEDNTRRLVRYLVEQGLDVERIEETKVSLEDIYLAMVAKDET